MARRIWVHAGCIWAPMAAHHANDRSSSLVVMDAGHSTPPYLHRMTFLTWQLARPYSTWLFLFPTSRGWRTTT